MTPRTRRLALSAAAKVTLVGAFACDKAPMVTAETVSTPSMVSDAGPPPIPPVDSRPTPPTTSACGASGVSAATPAALQCCTDALTALTTAMQKPTSPDDVACCSALVRANDERMRTGGAYQEFPLRGECCQALDWHGSMTCTPWGPPMPPEIDWIA